MIYIMEEGPGGPVKIGFGDPRERQRRLQTGNSNLISILAACHLGDDKDAEADLHQHLRSEHLRGEWFKRSPKTEITIQDLAAISNPDLLGPLRRLKRIPLSPEEVRERWKLSQRRFRKKLVDKARAYDELMKSIDPEYKP